MAQKKRTPVPPVPAEAPKTIDLPRARKSKAVRTSKQAGERILADAMDRLFPIPADVDPYYVGGLLEGYSAALDAVGYKVSP